MSDSETTITPPPPAAVLLLLLLLPLLLLLLLRLLLLLSLLCCCCDHYTPRRFAARIEEVKCAAQSRLTLKAHSVLASWLLLLLCRKERREDP